MKNEFLERLKEVDINQDDFAHHLIETLPNCYAKGFLACMEQHHDAEDYQELVEDLKEWCSWDIWK